MSEFLKGISPSLRSKVCEYVFTVMLSRNDIMVQFMGTNDKLVVLNFILKRIEILFVQPE